MEAFKNYEIWWVTGAQLLYGGDAVVAVDGHSKEMVDGLNKSGNIPVKIVYKGTANSSKEVEQVMLAANNDEKCVGIITWMHTFSPAKMWIKGLQQLQKPLLHFHTQYNAEIPWSEIDMDFMNLNQSAHGDIEFGHICTRMRVARKVVCGYWKDEKAQKQIAVWARVAAGVADAHNVRCLMFGMNMNNVAVTDGDRVEFEQRLGYHVDYYPVSSLMEYFKNVTDAEADALVEEYKKLYTIKIDESGETVYWEKVKNAAKAEIALRRVLKDEGATAFTTNFDDLGDANIDAPDFCGFDQIPGLASQRLMEEGYGFGAEGDWKTACLYRTLWVIQQGMPTGCSFLEDERLAGQSFRIRVDALRRVEQKWLLMLYYDLFENAGRFSSLQEMVDVLASDAIFCSELKEVMTLLLKEKKAYEKVDNSLLADFPLKLHGVYTKAQIQVAIGTSTLTRKSPAREGVERNKMLNVEAMFVDIIKNREEGSTTDYDDKALSPYLFQWDTQNRVRPESNEGQAYINQTQTMLLFVREQKNFVEDKTRTMGYVYLGRVTLSNWEYKDLGTRMQMQIRWNMVEPIPGSVMHFARMKEIA